MPLPRFSLAWAEGICDRFEELQAHVLKHRSQANFSLEPSLPHLNDQSAWSQFFLKTFIQNELSVKHLTTLPRPIVFGYLAWHSHAYHSQRPVNELLQRSQAIYTLCLAIDPLLTASEIGSLREIGKNAQLLWWHHPEAHELHAPLAMLFSILASPFSQLDLCEFIECESSN
ncbi:hypothetical protein HMI54_013402 [Coelomomyces lativittatus]|nr:hypothetical protein HMI54_013402 [Coelomomyces lativittatus]KAJ1499355.1 hypothetical protein HMI56_004438 [Coelomomyces lativittatus]